MKSLKLLKLVRLKGVKIKLASPENIKKWSERHLPNGKIIGQVTNSQTVNYQKKLDTN